MLCSPTTKEVSLLLKMWQRRPNSWSNNSYLLSSDSSVMNNWNIRALPVNIDMNCSIFLDMHDYIVTVDHAMTTI